MFTVHTHPDTKAHKRDHYSNPPEASRESQCTRSALLAWPPLLASYFRQVTGDKQCQSLILDIQAFCGCASISNRASVKQKATKLNHGVTTSMWRNANGKAIGLSIFFCTEEIKSAHLLIHKLYQLGCACGGNLISWASPQCPLSILGAPPTHRPSLEEQHGFFVCRAWSLCHMNFLWLLGTASSLFTWVLAVTKAPLPPWHQMENLILWKRERQNLAKVKTLRYVPDYQKSFTGSSSSKSTFKIYTFFFPLWSQIAAFLTSLTWPSPHSVHWRTFVSWSRM